MGYATIWVTVELPDTTEWGKLPSKELHDAISAELRDAGLHDVWPPFKVGYHPTPYPAIGGDAINLTEFKRLRVAESERLLLASPPALPPAAPKRKHVKRPTPF